ncbi:MAG: flavodoxin [Syntrophaceae bacterium]|nr:MAG: flavodoxin [Syntrophaceae bacterium]
MENRRSFVKKCLTGCAVGCLAMAAPGLSVYACAGRPQTPISKRNPKRALVLWYSQTGHTGRIGRIIRHVWEKAGLTVDAADYREIEKSTFGKYDLIAVGTPVYYMDVPVNLQDWIKTLPRIEGTSVAAYVTFGGKGNGQHNTACGLLEQMTDTGGAAAGIGLFGNMSTFAPTWSTGNAARILAFRDRPNEKTYQQARAFADNILANVAAGRTYKIDREFGLESLMGIIPQIDLTKLMITNHHIDKSLCIQCGTCIKKCPVDAIHLQAGTVNSKRCIACMGCVNNCPTQALKMNFIGKPVYGFKEFLKRNHINIMEPAEQSE